MALRSKDRWRSSFILSALIHLALLALLWQEAASGGQGQGGKKARGTPSSFEEAERWGKEDREEAERQARANEERRQILEKAQAGKEHDEPLQVSIHFLPPKEEKQEEEKIEGLTDCEGSNWYGGIGIHNDEATKEIIKVVAGYPASKAGLQVGDRLMMDTSQIVGLPGTPVTIIVERLGEVLVFPMTRDRICVEGSKP